MTTVIECAAQAMHASAQPEWSWDDPDYPQLRAIYRDAARAMIASLREPSALAVEAGSARLWDGSKSKANALATETWQAMIDAMLNEGDSIAQP
jgi:hypothetical protein